jgi:hypothetical protein
VAASSTVKRLMGNTETRLASCSVNRVSSILNRVGDSGAP